MCLIIDFLSSLWILCLVAETFTEIQIHDQNCTRPTKEKKIKIRLDANFDSQFRFLNIWAQLRFIMDKLFSPSNFILMGEDAELNL
ncbi:unnamed protein product [Rhizophagus irregularis]|nr:unnamed protein product [Rhizophagus irregularis]CAB4436890.1 unnamed protein product [Rhizophagus irregularis]